MSDALAVFYALLFVGAVMVAVYLLLSFVVGFVQGYRAARRPLPCCQLTSASAGGYYYCERAAGHAGPCVTRFDDANRTA